MANVLIEESILQGWADTIREKTGVTDAMLPSTMLTKTQEEWGTGSGGSDLVKYVTFMSWDGSEELFKKPTINGDDCVDVVAEGLMAKPTKASTETIVYEHEGWSLTSGGSTDSDALSDITEDRVVYATFSEDVRYYTVNFYTEVGVLHETVKVTYGGTALPLTEPTKEGYGFAGWSPSNENITADTDCFAVWTETIDFANASWEHIAKLSADGTISEKFSIGDEKVITLTDGTTLTLAIADFGVDDLADGSGKAGVTIINKNLSNSLKSVWANSGVIYANSTLREYLNSDSGVMGLLPSDLVNVIKLVSVQYEGQITSGAITPMTVDDKIFELSVYSYGVAMTASETTPLGPAYKGFRLGKLSAVAYVGTSSVADTHFTRSLRRRSSSAYARYINADGGVANQTSFPGNERYVRFGFCI